jgi:glyoxylase-like metal-dependent hydrolase (beta-lactamase superfamily II)
MSVNIFPIPLGLVHCYIIQDEGTIMIDGGSPKMADKFTKALQELRIKPEETQLIIITHGHWDHIGSAKEIKEITGAKIAMHQRDKDCLEKSLKRVPPGITPWGIMFSTMALMFTSFIHIPATKVDVVLGDEGLSLAEYGIPGKVLHTPGHSSGSVSVALETGDIFVGDLAMNKFPLRLTPGLPILAEDWSKLKESWELILEHGAKTIYPAHGDPFPADIIRKVLR